MRGRRAATTTLLFVPPIVGVLAVLWFPVADAASTTNAATTASATDARRFDARATYLADCATCHASDMRGIAKRGPSITRSDGALLDYEIGTGRMPLSEPHAVPHRHDRKYSLRDTRALIDYILSVTHAPDNVPRVDVRHADLGHGGQLFRLNCAACHTVTGEGGALLHRAAPPTKRASPTQIAEAVREGPGAMPAFGRASMNDKELSDLVAYTRYLARPKDRGGFPLGHVGPITEGLVGFGLGAGLLLVVARAIGTKS